MNGSVNLNVNAWLMNEWYMIINAWSHQPMHGFSARKWPLEHWVGFTLKPRLWSLLDGMYYGLVKKRRRGEDLFKLQSRLFRHPVLRRRESWRVPWVTGSMWKNSAINLRLVPTLFNLRRCFKYSETISHIFSEWSEPWNYRKPIY